jgi:hypothetical protein
MMMIKRRRMRKETGKESDYYAYGGRRDTREIVSF